MVVNVRRKLPAWDTGDPSLRALQAALGCLQDFGMPELGSLWFAGTAALFQTAPGKDPEEESCVLPLEAAIDLGAFHAARWLASVTEKIDVPDGDVERALEAATAMREALCVGDSWKSIRAACRLVGLCLQR